MANTRFWSDEKSNELYNFILEGRKKGFSIKHLSKEFSEKYPEFEPEQVRAHYYAALKHKEDNELLNIFRPWTNEDDDKLFSYVRQHQAEKPKTQIFEELAPILDRDPQAIAARFYKLKRQSLEISSAKEILNSIGKLKSSQAEKFIELLNKFTEDEKKQKEIQNLKEKLKKANEETKNLKEEILEKEEEIKKAKELLNKNVAQI